MVQGATSAQVVFAMGALWALSMSPAFLPSSTGT
eukprot:CAMPEP_0185904366 /NCGR_PEP_ID=MMETSP0196C-20130402/3668_1 /TAXON_ID=2932 /ORGANISM="Alexandrium fundyense, Strain CCMP1719" /LENGTH=33 /DNA_ID= /DNA_START= /DNA_END= /DNA_ORIENTATION=